MDGDVPEGIQEKMKIIEKEMEFTKRMKPPQKIQIWLGIFLILGGILTSIGHKSYFALALFFLLGGMNIAAYFEYKKLFRIHSNACDIIHFYKNREVLKKHNKSLNNRQAQTDAPAS